MSAPALDIRVPLGRPLPELAGFARRCEDAGLPGVGVPDHHHVGRDAYATLAAMAGAELDPTRIFLFPAHSWETTYDLPEEAVAAAGSHLVPALEELS